MNHRRNKAVAMRTLLWGFLAMMVAMPLPAQETSPETDAALANPAPEQVGQEAADILSRLERIVKEARGYQEKLATASAEDSLVLQLQLDGNRDRFMDVLPQLAEIVTADKKGVSDELRQRAETIYTAVTPDIWRLIGEIRVEIDGLRAGRNDASPADRSALEDHISRLTTRLDRFYRYGGDHLKKLEAMGQDTAAPRATFAVLLSGRADELSGRLQLATLRIGELNRRLRETPDDADITALLTANRKSLDVNAISLEVVLTLMEAEGLPTHPQRELLIATTQDLASGLLDPRVTGTLLKKAWTGITTWLADNGPIFLVKLLLFLVIMFSGRFLARLVRTAVEKSLGRANLNFSQLLRRMITNAAHNVVVGLALLIALSQLGISLGPLLAGFGVVGFILGFAMQDSLSNLAAGMMILVNRPYDVGDLVEISGVFGKVEHMSMVSTSILTLDNQKLVVPNSRIWGDVIKNVTDQKVRRVDLVFGISYSDDIPHAERVLNEILEQNERVLADPEPMVRVHALGESSVDFVVRPWVKTPDYWDVHWDVTRAVKMRFDEEGISIPFPQQDVHFFGTKPVHQGELAASETGSATTHAQDPDEIAGDEG